MSFTLFIFSFSGTIWLKNSTSSQQDRLLGDLATALSTANNAMVKGTSEKQLHAWQRFQSYLQSIDWHWG